MVGLGGTMAQQFKKIYIYIYILIICMSINFSNFIL